MLFKNQKNPDAVRFSKYSAAFSIQKKRLLLHLIQKNPIEED
jgi:hypothetical protein